MKLSEFTTTYVSALNNQQVGANIVCIVRRLIDHCGDVELSDLHSVDLTAWSAAIVAERGVLHETARGYCKIIRRLWRGAADRGLCDPPPAITSKRPPRERSTSIPADQWEPQRLALADVQANTPLTVVWVSCFPAAERDKQTKFALLDLCELLERPPIVSDLAGSTFERFASWAPGLGQSTKTVERRLSCLRRLRRDLAAHGAEPIPRPPKPKRARRGLPPAGRTPIPADVGADQAGSLAHFFLNTYQPLRLRSGNASTMRNHLYAIRHFSHFLSRPAMLTDLDDATVSRLLMHRREHGGSARAVNCVRDRLLAVWNYAARKKLVETFPDIPPEPQPYRAPQAWTIAELAKLVKAAGKVRGHVGDVPARDWWPALILTAWCSAERISALMACKWSWLDGCGFLTVRGECRKGQRADIVRKLSAEALAALERIRSPARDLIFEWPKSPSSLWMGFRRIVKAAGLKPGRESGFHRLRRSAASHFCAAGGNPSALLGHADQRIVARYLDERITAPTQACDLLPSLTHKAHTS